ncbi:MAG: hypothetical protein AMXMBFR57_15140 [Acidimicrobiia bacterium]
MTKSKIVLSVGETQYWAASREFTKSARDPGYGSAQSQIADTGPTLPHDIEALIWDSDLSSDEKIALFFELFDDLPSYGMLMYAKHQWREWTDEERGVWWREFRARLLGEFPAPLTYSLWCDFFEDSACVTEGWRAVTSGADVGLLLRVLPVSGPVPWSLKRPYLWRSLLVPKLRSAAFDGLLGAAFDVFGQVNKQEARLLAWLLQRSIRDSRYSQLRQQLSS